MLNPKTAVKLVPALALAAAIGSYVVRVLAAPAVNPGADNAIVRAGAGYRDQS